MSPHNSETLLALAMRLRAEATELRALASELVDEADQLTEMAEHTRAAPYEAGHVTAARPTRSVTTH